MKRLCIYVIYDSDNQIDDYIKNVLCELTQNCEYLIVVCNFEKIIHGEEIVNLYADEIKYRKNVGYDFGAYKDELCNLLVENRLNSYDEVILTNDTYFVTAYSFSEMFSKMDTQQCDFWGVTEHKKNEKMNVIATHIQSYFLAFRKKVFLSCCFKNYWQNLKYYNNIEQAINYGEMRLTEYFNSFGYRSMVYTDIWKLPYLVDFCDNPYVEYPYELIKDARLPIFKIKCLSWAPLLRPSTIEAMYYMKDSLNVDITNYVDHIIRVRQKIEGNVWFDESLLKKFVEKYSEIYVYGMGTWGEIIDKYFQLNGWSFISYLETNPKDENKSKKIETLAVNENVGIIIAQMKKENAKEICDNVLRYGFKRSQVIMPQYR